MAYRPLAHCVAALLVLLVVCLCGSASAEVTETQKTDTLAFLQSFASNFRLTNWTGSAYCDWSGINCGTDDLVSLDLSATGITGVLPNVTSTDTLVAKMDLSGNTGLTGSLPHSWVKLNNLVSLDVSNSGLKGYVPDAWNGMPKLASIMIANTNTCGALPDWANMPSLTTVDFSNNNMRGVLSSMWSNISTLTSVKLTGNSFCGCEPSAWKNITVLHNAVSSMSVASSSCETSNMCDSNSYNCEYTGNNDASMGLVSTLLAIACIFCSLIAY